MAVPGIDRAQLERDLALTPTERLEAVEQMMTLGEELHRAMKAKRESAK